MSDWIALLRGGLLFDTATFQTLRERRDGMLRGALLVVAVALIAALPTFVIDLVNGLQAHPLTPSEVAQATANFEQGLQTAPYMQSMPPEVLNQIRQWFEAGVQIAQEIQALPTPLPRPIGGLLEAVGRWLSRPFGGATFPLAVASLATWLGYGIWVTLAAKLLGGRAGLREFFGSTSLYAAPHLLNIFSFVPFVGVLAGLVAFFWGAAIYVKATAVSQEMGTGRALLAVLLPVLVGIGLLVVVLIVLGIVLAVASGQR